jgi:replicative DNA helicase Mcm
MAGISFEDEDKEFIETSKNIVVDEYIDQLQDFFETIYKKQIDHLAFNYPDLKSLEIDYKDLENYDLAVAETLLETPQLIFEAAEIAIQRVDVGVLDSEVEFKPHIRFFNLPDEHAVSIRDIGAEHLNKLVSVEGVIKVITERLEKLVLARFVCRKCNNIFNIPQKTQTLSKPVICECKSREFDIDLEQSKFIDYQKIQIQEPLENLQGSQQASNIDIYLSDDLVNKCVAGEKVVITGVLKLKPPKGDTNIYQKYLVAYHLEKTEQEYDELKITDDEVREIKQLAKKDDIYKLLSASIAPNIFGHDIVKEAITLQMFSGVKKKIGPQLLRGNIHILLVGDPSTGKSQLLTYADSLAPKSIYVAGKTASGAGLTVSAVKDDFGEGGWTLKAGAVILASGGLAMIDEFDKMDTDDRSALHEAMAQGTVSVSKAGLYSKFKADTSILAAANPKLNRFDQYKSALEQIDLPFSLLSRFDLFFIIKDMLNKELDEDIARHIIKTHESAEKYVKSLKEKTISKADLEDIEKVISPPVAIEIFKKYVAYARQNIKPILSKDASQLIIDYYTKLRDVGRKSGSYSATPRQLEGLIRLSEASAKIKLKQSIDVEDAERAIKVFKTSMEQTAVDKETGIIDIDIISTGQSTSERSQLKKLLSLIKDLTQEDSEGTTFNELFEILEKEGMTREKLAGLIKKLKNIGELYEPKSGHYKVVAPDFQ